MSCPCAESLMAEGIDGIYESQGLFSAIILAGWNREVYALWLKELAEFKPVMYTGSESPKQKDQAKEDFVTGKSNCFIMSLRSGAGLDGLQYRCSTVILGEIDWSKKIHDQLIGRVDREGQTEQVMAIFCTCEDGSDPPIIDVIGLKESISRGVIDPTNMVDYVTSDDSRIRALAKMFISKRELHDIEHVPHETQPHQLQLTGESA